MEKGQSKKERRQVADSLSHILSDTLVLAVKYLNYHWNVKGRLFKSLHDLFEDHYKDLFGAADDLAERIRALGFLSPGSFKDFLALSAIKEETAYPEAADMIETLVQDQETVMDRLKEALTVAATSGDEATADLLTQRLGIHGKMTWMLRSHLEG